jgi:hypothetical protein
MDLGTMMRELDEVIARAQSAATRESTLLNALPDCGLRRRKQRQVRASRDHCNGSEAFAAGYGHEDGWSIDGTWHVSAGDLLD